MSCDNLEQMIQINLETILARKHMSVYRLAKITGIDAHNLHKIKNNKVDYIKFDSLNKICKALSVKPGKLLDIVPDDEDYPMPSATGPEWLQPNPKKIDWIQPKQDKPEKESGSEH